MGLLSDYVLSIYGMKLRFKPNPVTKTALVGVTQIFRENADRIEVLVMNLSSNTLYIHTEPTVSPTNGVLLAPNGGAVNLTAEYDGEWVGYPFYVYATVQSAIFTTEVTG